MSLRDTLEHLLSGKSLSEAEAGDLLRALDAAPRCRRRWRAHCWPRCVRKA